MRTFTAKDPFRPGRDQSGFSLLELMVVVMIIGLSLGVLFNLDFTGSRQRLRQEAAAFANGAALVMDEAVLGGEPWGVDFYRETAAAGGESQVAYRWLQYGEDGWREGVPVGMEDNELLSKPVLLAPETRVVLALDGLPADIEEKVDLADPRRTAGEFAPEIWLYPNHEATAFDLVFQGADSGRVGVVSDLLGRIRLEESP